MIVRATIATVAHGAEFDCGQILTRAINSGLLFSEAVFG
jgi:hypothetical protein